jgi:hypothetical protein
MAFHDRAERSGHSHPSEGHAGDPDNARGMRRLDARAMGRSEGVAATVPDEAMKVVARGTEKEDVASPA